MHADAENCAEHRTQDGQNNDLYRGSKSQLRYILNHKCSRSHFKNLRNSITNQRSQHTWNQCSIVHNADTDYLNCKDGRSQRCSKQGCKAGTHPTHNHHLVFLLVKIHPVSKSGSHAAANLQCCAFSARRTTQQVGDNGADKNQRCCTHSQRMLPTNRLNDGVGSHVLCHTAFLIQQSN